MTKIYLCRHGETKHNEKGIIQGHKDVELNQKGRKQAQKLAERFQNINLKAVYSSDLKRSSSTAEEIVKERDIPHIKDQRLRERNWSKFEGKPRESRYKEIENGDDLDDLKPEKGESVHDVRERASKIIEEIEEKHPEGQVVIVAHGWVNRALITELLNAEQGRAQSIIQDNTAVNIFRKEDFRGWRIVKINDTSHL